MSLNDYVCEKPVFHTKQLTLRALTAADADDLREWTPDKALYRYWGKNPGKADKDPALLFASPKKPTKSFHWGIVPSADFKVIGEVWVYLIENDRMAKVAIRLGRKYHGYGCGTEVLRETVRFCFVHNGASSSLVGRGCAKYCILPDAGKMRVYPRGACSSGQDGLRLV